VKKLTVTVFPGVQSSLSVHCSLIPPVMQWRLLPPTEQRALWTSPVWSDYRRNHKGGIPPSEDTHNLHCKCNRDDKIFGNPHPICRDPNVIIHYQLLQQFISPYTGVVYDPTRTGKIQYLQKVFIPAIAVARDQVKFRGDYSNSHDYRWYNTMQPDETEVAKV
uniref:Mitochondrial ribosomal protein S18B n=1 Tax=Oncorhynchus kisutch TaxID=8019 RepID=A0A8C7G176_ONCKI